MTIAKEKLLRGLFWLLFLLFGFTLACLFVHLQITHDLTFKEFVVGILIWILIWLGFSIMVIKSCCSTQSAKEDIKKHEATND